MSETVDNAELDPISPLDVMDQLARDLQTLDKRSHRAMVSGDRLPREVMIEHYTAVRDHLDDAIQVLKGEDAPS